MSSQLSPANGSSFPPLRLKLPQNLDLQIEMSKYCTVSYGMESYKKCLIRYFTLAARPRSSFGSAERLCSRIEVCPCFSPAKRPEFLARTGSGRCLGRPAATFPLFYPLLRNRQMNRHI